MHYDRIAPKMFPPRSLVKIQYCWGSMSPTAVITIVACSASDRQGSNFESCVWREVSSHSSHDPQEALLAQFSLYVHTVVSHTFESLRVKGKETFCFLEDQSGVRARDHRLSKQAALITVPGSPPSVASNNK